MSLTHCDVIKKLPHAGAGINRSQTTCAYLARPGVRDSKNTYTKHTDELISHPFDMIWEISTAVLSDGGARNSSVWYNFDIIPYREVPKSFVWDNMRFKNVCCGPSTPPYVWLIKKKSILILKVKKMMYPSNVSFPYFVTTISGYKIWSQDLQANISRALVIK